MANILANVEVVKTQTKSRFIFSLSSDGSVEANAKKIVLSSLPGAPKKVKITGLNWAVSPGVQVGIRFDRPAVSGPRILCESSMDLAHGALPIEDKDVAGTGSGDIEFTSYGLANGLGYTVDIEVQAVKE